MNYNIDELIELANRIDRDLPPTPHLNDDQRENHCNALAAYLIDHDMPNSPAALLTATAALLAN